jgi:hypothetical protein
LLTDSRIPPIKTLNSKDINDILATSGIKYVNLLK